MSSRQVLRKLKCVVLFWFITCITVISKNFHFVFLQPPKDKCCTQEYNVECFHVFYVSSILAPGRFRFTFKTCVFTRLPASIRAHTPPAQMSAVWKWPLPVPCGSNWLGLKQPLYHYNWSKAELQPVFPSHWETEAHSLLHLPPSTAARPPHRKHYELRKWDDLSTVLYMCSLLSLGHKYSTYSISVKQKRKKNCVKMVCANLDFLQSTVL